jgi:hypothetical protein
MLPTAWKARGIGAYLFSDKCVRASRQIYLDYNASTPIDPVVAAAMRPYVTVFESVQPSRKNALRVDKTRPALSGPESALSMTGTLVKVLQSL